MDSALHERPLSVQEAYDALEAFGRDLGRVRLLLLMHASVPQSFRADLLNLLKVNFLASEAGADLTVDSDVLLSPIVQPAAAGYYRLDPEVRRHCLALLDATYRDRPVRRSVEVARLLLAYAEALERQAGLRLDSLLAEYLSIQRWVAASFIDPEASAEAFASALNRVLEKSTSAAALKLGGVTAAISIPLGGHQTLLAYARSVDAIGRGDSATSRRLTDWMGDREIHVGGVALRPVRDVMQRLDVRVDDVEPPPPTKRTLLVNVPDGVGIINGREGYLADVRGMLIGRRNPGRGDRPDRTRVVSIIGADGSGKWALANALAHDQAVQSTFTDGIIWLGEKGYGYPTAELDEYANAAGVTDLLDRSGDSTLVNVRGFRSLFANVAVLFIADQRSASDIVPTIMNEAGPACAVLRLTWAGEKRAPGAIELGPLERVYAEHSLVRLLGGSFPVRDLVAFTDGNPLVTRVVECAVSQRWGSDGQRRNAAAITRDSSSLVTVADKVSRVMQVVADALPDAQLELLREMSKLPQERTRFTRDELGSLGISDPDTLVSVVYDAVDVLGDTIRIHRLIRNAVNDLAERRPPEAAQEAAPHEERHDRAPGQIFVSYARADRDAAQRIIDSVRSVAGRDAVYVPEERLRPGDFFEQQIDTAIREASLFIAVLSRRIPESAWVKREWEIAFAEQRRRSDRSRYIVPIAVDDISSGGPELPGYITEREWVFAPNGVLDSRGVRDIVSAIREYRKRDGETSAEPATDHAIVMSVSQYPRLRPSAVDAARGSEAFQQWLIRGRDVPPPEVHLITDRGDGSLTNASFVRILADWAARASATPEARVGRRLYWYFSGLVAVASGGELLLVTADADVTSLQHISLRHSVDWLRSSALFDQIVVCVDAVDIDEPNTYPAVPIPLVTRQSRRTPVSVFVVTGRSEREIPPTSLTTVLLNGVSGQARDTTGRVTASSLAGFLRGYVGRPGWPQMEIQQSGREIVFADAPRPA